jgi:hypothetical protein
MKREAAFFADREAALVYIAKSLNDALRLEKVFDSSGIDYAVEADEYRGGVIFQRARVGAFFYVPPEAREIAREVMQRNGYKPYDEPEPPVKSR